MTPSVEAITERASRHPPTGCTTVTDRARGDDRLVSVDLADCSPVSRSVRKKMAAHVRLQWVRRRKPWAQGPVCRRQWAAGVLAESTGRHQSVLQ